MTKNSPFFASSLAVILLVAAPSLLQAKEKKAMRVAGIHLHDHSRDDDLLTAGLGASGLRSPVPPPFADANHPTGPELRRRAIWTSWRGIADLAPGGGYGGLYGYLQPIPGREYHALV